MDFTFIAASVMHFYALGYKDFLALPYYTFWELSRNIDRVRADEDRRLLVLLGQVIGGDPAKYSESLERERGEVIVMSKEYENKQRRDAIGSMRKALGR